MMLASCWRFDRGCARSRREERGKNCLTCGRTRERDPAPEPRGDRYLSTCPPAPFTVPMQKMERREGHSLELPRGPFLASFWPEIAGLCALSRATSVSEKKVRDDCWVVDMMFEIAGGIVLAVFALWALDLLLLSFLTTGGQTFWLIAIGGLIGLALLASLPGGFIATVAIGAFAFAMARKHAPNWTPWRDSKGESVFGGGRPNSPSGGLDLRPIKTDRKGRRL
jgi:hypothetical protein